MKKYFTKEYIKECDNKKIQELFFKKFSEEIDYGSWYFDTERNEIMLASIKFLNRTIDPICCFYLPTGDQLDDEIIRFCKNKQCNIYLDIILSNPIRYELDVINESKEIAYSRNKNPLIAKIKLLKQLLK